jgi:putative nucleotidyltransferase with HDIG domain
MESSKAALAPRRREVPSIVATPTMQMVIFGLLLTLALTATLTFQLLPSRYALNEGDVSPYDIKAPAKVTFTSLVRTNQERARVDASIPDVYRPTPDAPARAQSVAANALNQVGQLRSSSIGDAQKVSQIEQIPGLTLTVPVATDIVGLNDVQWRQTVTSTLRIVDRSMHLSITTSQLSDVKSAVATMVDPGLSDSEATAVIALARNFITPTEEVDQLATAAAKKAAEDAVQPVQVTLEKGETILRNGDLVGALEVEKLDAAGLRNPTIQWPQILGMAFIGLALAAIVTLYAYQFQQSLVNSPRRRLLLGFLLVVPVIAAKLTVPGRELYGYLFPIAAAPMLLSILLDAETSLVMTAVQAVLLGLVTNADLELVLATLVAGCLSAMWVHRLERVSTLTSAAAIVAVANFGVIVSFHLASQDLDLQQLALYGFLATVSGGLSAALTLGLVSFLGNVFGIATTMNLLELAHPSQPLFRRLLTEAPGTYHHSVVVANLAERATSAVGGDTLLARIGGYYHDIGKLTRPYVFIENQVDGQNVHDQLDAYTSARLILSHVTDGLDLAAKHGVPTRVQDMIAQHHGTMLVQYFFWQASQGADQTVDETAFRYDGPKPQTREAAIMMLADGVEATVRANRDHSSENIAAVVDRIIQDRVTSGQLDDCDLTLADLRKIRQAFLSVLQGIFHPRIDYPSDVGRPRVAIANPQ